MSLRRFIPAVLFVATTVASLGAQAPDSARIERLKAEASTKIDARAKLIQEIIDHQFSFSELGFQEFETQKYLTGLLKQNGFDITLGYAGMPSAWVARWGSGKPVIALGSDVDGIPQSNNKPGVAFLDPQVAGAPASVAAWCP